MNAPCGCRWSYTRLLFALATAYRLLCAHEATGGEPVGWQRWRCQLFEQSRDLVIVCAQGYDGIFHMAEDLLHAAAPPGWALSLSVLQGYHSRLQ
jgi:hypothetical protein